MEPVTLQSTEDIFKLLAEVSLKGKGLAPRDENELVLITSLLEGNGIDFFVQNEYFGGLYPGLNIFPFNERVILVAEADFDRASLLARDFLESIEVEPRQEGQAG